MDRRSKYATLVKWLEEKGHTDSEIDTILAKVHDYDQKTLSDGVMDSIGDGNFDLDQLIQEALASPKEE